MYIYIISTDLVYETIYMFSLSTHYLYCFRARGEHLTIQLLWAATQLLVTRFSFASQVDEFSLKEMRMWDQSNITSHCICFWCQSGELGGRRSSRFPCVTPVVETSYNRTDKHQQQSSSAKTANDLKHIDCFCKKVHNIKDIKPVYTLPSQKTTQTFVVAPYCASLIFFNQVTPSWITTSGIALSPEIRWYSMHLYFTHNPHLLHLWLDPQSDWRSVAELFVETVNVFRPLTVFAEELHCWCLATLS